MEIMNSAISNLIEAEKKAAELFSEIENRGLIIAGKSEKDMTNYIHPDNHQNMFAPDKRGNKRDWILEIHFVNKEKEIGGFFLTIINFN